MALDRVTFGVFSGVSLIYLEAALRNLSWGRPPSSRNALPSTYSSCSAQPRRESFPRGLFETWAFQALRSQDIFEPRSASGKVPGGSWTKLAEKASTQSNRSRL